VESIPNVGCIREKAQFLMLRIFLEIGNIEYWKMQEINVISVAMCAHACVESNTEVFD